MIADAKVTGTPNEHTKLQIEFHMSHVHVGVADTEVYDEIFLAAVNGSPPADEAFAAKCAEHAVKVHHENQRLYSGVMTGRLS